MSIGIKDITAIKPGRSKVFKVERPTLIKSAMSMCCYIKNMQHTPEGVERYSCTADYENLQVVITAVKKRAI